MIIKLEDIEDISKPLEVELQYNEQALYILKEELRKRTTYKWKTKDGYIDVKEMSNEHLINSINKLEKHLNEVNIYLEKCIDAFDYD